MPIYEYRCSECSEIFEALQRVHDEPLNRCRICGGPARRIISSPAIRFVGSGWYVTDYARKGSARKDRAERNPPSGAASSSKSPSSKSKSSGRETSAAKAASG